MLRIRQILTEAFLNPSLVKLSEEDAVHLSAVGCDDVQGGDQPAVVSTRRRFPPARKIPVIK